MEVYSGEMPPQGGKPRARCPPEGLDAPQPKNTPEGEGPGIEEGGSGREHQKKDKRVYTDTAPRRDLGMERAPWPERERSVGW